MNEFVKKLGLTIAGAVLVVFAGAFFLEKQYWFTFWTLCLLLLLLRLEDIRRLVVNKKEGISAELKDERKK